MANEIVLADRDYKRSNFLISTKYKASLLENRLMAVSLSKISNSEYEEDAGGNLIVHMKASELKKLFNTNSGSFYEKLDAVSQVMTGRSLGWTNPEEHSFQYIALVTKASYADGVFTIEFNHHLKKYIKNLTENFTILNLPTMLAFKYDSSFRLYELLKSKAYSPRGKIDTGVYHIDFDLAELKLELGVVNANSDRVQRILNGEEAPNYEKAVEAAPERTYDRWSDFNNRILKKATKEINEISDIFITYDTLGSGRGGKIYKVLFTIEKKSVLQKKEENNSKRRELSKDEKFEFLDEMRDILGQGFKTKDLDAIAEAADFDMEKIRKAYDSLAASRTTVDNPTGFLISAVREGYTAVPPREAAGNSAAQSRGGKSRQANRSRSRRSSANAFTTDGMVNDHDYNFASIELHMRNKAD